ncbi:response regulator [Bacillus sp. FJAT-49736]|uniref:response regulator transcription factor n=1 Tax=Bacillus sp. FJAT-49736 TaxID=2833582 RepID=UPI001BC93F1E|nr:response regulator [Bacillus sp. FJAT-49736]MBS4174286.1 response regulator [Bacillus sp. FJAT-49736]
MKRILLAEDEEVLRMLITDTLEDQDFAVQEAEDGQEAIQYLEENKYDLLILDYMMPKVSGIEVIKYIREKQKDHHLKILMLSAKSQQFEQEKVFDAGANFFMAKPFSPIELLAKIEGILYEN